MGQLIYNKSSQELRMLSSVTLNSRVTMIVMNSGHEISTISHKLTSHVMSLSWSLYSFLYLSFVFQQVMSPHHSDQMSQRSQYSRIALWWCSLYVYVFASFVLVIFFVQIMSPYCCYQMSQRSQISGIALWRCSPNAFVFIIVFVFVKGNKVTSHKS